MRGWLARGEAKDLPPPYPGARFTGEAAGGHGQGARQFHEIAGEGLWNEPLTVCVWGGFMVVKFLGVATVNGSNLGQASKPKTRCK